VVRDLCGHGIGTHIHEEPNVLNYGEPGRGPRLQEGMVFAIEPMVNIGGPDVKVLDDDWTAVTADGTKSAHFEHTVAVTSNGPWVLTRPRKCRDRLGRGRERAYGQATRTGKAQGRRVQSEGRRHRSDGHGD
jgi:Xaa-Pro aminopeptidase